MPDLNKLPSDGSKRAEIDAFLTKLDALAPVRTASGRGRLVFAMDATMSRGPTWDTAREIQAEMFNRTEGIGGLDVQLVYFRGAAECKASGWVSDAKRLGALMRTIQCHGGFTQLGRVLTHVLGLIGANKVQAVVFVGDAMEEPVDALCSQAGQLGLLGVPAFMFQEGDDPDTEAAFREIARLSRGAYGRFDRGAAQQLAELLGAVAAYAAGGMRALSDLGARKDRGAVQLLGQLR